MSGFPLQGSCPFHDRGEGCNKCWKTEIGFFKDDPPEMAGRLFYNALRSSMNHFDKHLTLMRELLRSSNLTGRTSRNALGSLTVRMGAVLLAFLLSVVLARLSGMYQYGSYVYAVGWLNVLLVPATFGFDKLLVRQVAIYQSRHDWNNLKGIYQFAAPRAMFVSIVVGLFLLGTVYFIAKEHPLASVFYLAALLVPILSMIRLQQATLQGLNFVALGQLPELIIQPLALLLLILVVSYSMNLSLKASQIMVLSIVAGVVALYFGRLMMKRVFPSEMLEAVPVQSSQDWISSLVPLMVMNGIYILNDQLAIILLGLMGDARDVAVFSAAERWARFTIFMLYALNPVLGPVFARLYANNEKERLQKVVTVSAQIIALGALIPLLAFVTAPRLFLSVFGNDFYVGRTPLVILGIGQFINAFTGSVGVLLSMTGYERAVVFGALLGVLVNLLLGFLLIPYLHATGAAIGASVSTIVTNVVLAIFIFRTLKIFPTALGSRFAKRDVSLS